MANIAARERAPRRRGRIGGCLAATVNLVLNVLTGALVLLTLLSVLAITAIFLSPGLLALVPGGSQLIATNLPVPATAVALALPSATPLPGTQVEFPTLPPEWTATSTPTITGTPPPRTSTPEPSATAPRPTRTATFTPTTTATPTRVPSRTPPGPTAPPTNTRSPFNYTLQPGSPTYLSNFLNNAGCNWFGVVGRAFGVDDRPIIGLMVKVIQDQTELPPVLTGSAPAIGAGGYEVYLGDHPVSSTNLLRVQLFSNTGTPLSEQYSIDTHADCTRNLIMVNFLQNH
jgi:hypothetical protein